MKRSWKLVFLAVAVLMTLLIYKLTYTVGYRYVSLGDFLAVGVNSFGEENYGYSDYVKDYLQEKEMLRSYNNSFGSANYNVNDLKEDIETNKRKNIDNNEVSIRKVLRESDIVTISIGMNDFLSLFNNNFDYDNIEEIINHKSLCLNRMDKIIQDIDNMLTELKKYAKGDIILLGYYNPFPYFESYKNEIDSLIEYGNSKLVQICNRQNIYYVDIFDDFQTQNTYFSNPNSIYPNNYGHKVISNSIISSIKANIIN